MRKIMAGIVLASLIFAGSCLPVAHADEGLHFHCPTCGAHDHGSSWHDSDKDGIPDR